MNRIATDIGWDIVCTLLALMALILFCNWVADRVENRRKP